MKRQGIEKAAFRLSTGKSALEAAEQSKDHITFFRHWSEFLASIDGIYNCLGQSTNNEPASTNWFRSLAELRKRDPLLCYLWHARNSDNHGIEAPAEFVLGRMSVGGGGEDGFSRKIEVNFNTIPGQEFFQAKALDGKPIKIEQTKPIANLLPVEDRGVTYPPPTSHLGTTLQDQTAIAVGRLAAAFFESRLNEAWKLMT